MADEKNSARRRTVKNGADSPTTTGRGAQRPVASAGGTAPSSPGLAAGMAGGAARNAVADKVAGDSDSTARQVAAQYAGTAAEGAVRGAVSGGGLHGAAAGAAGAVGKKGASDAKDKVSGDSDKDKDKGERKDASGDDEKDADKKTDGDEGSDGSSGTDGSDGPGGSGTPSPGERGAGGTGPKKPSADPEDKLQETGKNAAKKGAAATAAATPKAMVVIAMMKLLEWLKTMFFMALAAMINGAQALLGLLINAVKAVWNAVTAPFAAIGSFFGGALGLGTAAVAAVSVTSGISAVLAVVLAIAALVGGFFIDDGATLGNDDGRSACVVSSSGSSGEDGSGTAADVSAQTEANAQKVYSVLKTWGMPDENIAGILGNWSHESGIDPTIVEGYYENRFVMTDAKKSAAVSLPDGKNGIGLAQWTAGRNHSLRAFAESKGKDWWALPVQLSFMATADNPGDVAIFKQLISTSQGSPAEAAYFFYDKWERPRYNASDRAERGNVAATWMGKMSSWKVDPAVADEVESIAGPISDGVVDGSSSAAGSSKCDNTGSAGLVDGGMNQEQAEAFIEKYRDEGAAFLDAKYGGGGPASCNGNHAMNCVSFSTWFLNNYTTYDTFPAGRGNGVELAYSVADDLGMELMDDPKPYAVGSGPGLGAAGHTMVALGINGDQVIIGEASYCNHDGLVRIESAAALKADGWKWLDTSSIMKDGADLDG